MFKLNYYNFEILIIFDYDLTIIQIQYKNFNSLKHLNMANLNKFSDFYHNLFIKR